MKSRDEILGRLKTLRHRYVKKSVRSSQERRPCNCVHNEEHLPRALPSPGVETDLDIMPRRATALVVIQPDFPVRLCMYGSEDASTWAGIVCDRDETAKHCPKFKPRVTAEQAETDAEALFKDDEWVFEHMKDVAALQWVLGDRVYKHEPTLMQRFRMWLQRRFSKPPAALPPPPRPPDLPPDFWSDSDDPSVGP